MPPVVIMLVETLRTSEAWHPALPHVSGATRRSPGFTKRTYSGLSFSHSRVQALGICRLVRQFWIARLRVRLPFRLIVFRRAGCDARGHAHVGVSSVAIRAAEAQRAGRVHGRLVGLRVAGNASGALAVGFLLRLAHQVWAGLFIGGAQRRRGNARGH